MCRAHIVTAGGLKPQVAVWEREQRRKSLSPPIGLHNIIFLRPRASFSFDGAGSQLVLPNDAGEPDD